MSGKAAETESPVPEAVGRILGAIWERMGPQAVDRVWIFPPLVRGRKEFGLVAVSGFTPDPEQRALFTARYWAELTGRGVEFESEIKEEGSAPPDRLPRVMDGVVRRSDLQLSDPKEITIEGDPDAFLALALAHGWDGPPDPLQAQEVGPGQPAGPLQPGESRPEPESTQPGEPRQETELGQEDPGSGS